MSEVDQRAMKEIEKEKVRQASTKTNEETQIDYIRPADICDVNLLIYSENPEEEKDEIKKQ